MDYVFLVVYDSKEFYSKKNFKTGSTVTFNFLKKKKKYFFESCWFSNYVFEKNI